MYAGEPWDGAWRARTHDALAAQAQRAALLLHVNPALSGSGPSGPAPSGSGLSDPGPSGSGLSDPGSSGSGAPGPGSSGSGAFGGGSGASLPEVAAAELDRILSAYARDYLAYAPHGQAAGTGRVQPQSLDEAVWAVGLLRAARWAGDALAPETARAVDGLAGAVADLLRPQVGAVHNIHCWLLAALAECAARLGDADLLAWCRDGEYGAEAQVRQGFHPEGLWYEINPHYHYYALAALLSYVEATGPAGLSEESAAHLSRAIAAPPLLAYADGRLPAYGDGWPDCFTGDFAPQAEAAWTLLPNARPDLAPYYRDPRPAPLRLWYGAQLPEHTTPLPHRPSVAALVFGPDDLLRHGRPLGLLPLARAGHRPAAIAGRAAGPARGPRRRLARPPRQAGRGRADRHRLVQPRPRHERLRLGLHGLDALTGGPQRRHRRLPPATRPYRPHPGLVARTRHGRVGVGRPRPAPHDHRPRPRLDGRPHGHPRPPRRDRVDLPRRRHVHPGKRHRAGHGRCRRAVHRRCRRAGHRRRDRRCGRRLGACLAQRRTDPHRPRRPPPPRNLDRPRRTPPHPHHPTASPPAPPPPPATPTAAPSACSSSEAAPPRPGSRRRSPWRGRRHGHNRPPRG
ncbi:hypothetical protein ACFQQB_02395 [Nonomuraea rubra]|uniref:hypothetical protein n=1 Tax=Nonomuraea rubra TaxID=46180 RepID=UPI0036240408